jgi:hypothetical protein
MYSAQTKPQKSLASRVCIGLAVCYALACLASVLHLQSIASVPFPFEDEIAWWRTIWAAHNGEFSLREIISPHNQHPIWTVRFAAWLTIYLGLPWNTLHYLYTALSVVTLGFTAWIVNRSGVNGWRLALVIVAASSLLLSAKQWNNLYWGIQVSFIACVLFAMVAFVAADRLVTGPFKTTGLMAGALTAGFLSLVSLGAGAVAWGVLLCALWFVRPTVPRAVFCAALLVAGALLVWFTQRYADYFTPPNPRADVATMGKYFLISVANSVWHVMAETITFRRGQLVGTLILGLALMVGWWSLADAAQARKSSTGASSTGALTRVCLIAFSLCTLALITVSRTGFGEWTSPRYPILLVPMWLAVVWGLVAPTQQYRHVKHALALAVTSGLVVMNIVNYSVELPIAPYRHENMHKAWTKYCAGDPLAYPQFTDRGFNLPGQPKMQQVFCGNRQ